MYLGKGSNKKKEKKDMERKSKRTIIIAICFFATFVLWTALLKLVDVQEIGPRASSVGMATLNGAVRDFFGVNFSFYIITDWLGLVPIAVAFGFTVLGLVQWIKRKSIFRVDYSILMLGVFYIAVIASYLFFEFVVINFRPTLINGYLEASYPSSTTMIVITVMTTAIMQFRERIKNDLLRRILITIIVAFIAFMLIFRIASGVHWISDIIGGVLLSVSLVFGYRFLLEFKK